MMVNHWPVEARRVITIDGDAQVISPIVLLVS